MCHCRGTFLTRVAARILKLEMVFPSPTLNTEFHSQQRWHKTNTLHRTGSYIWMSNDLLSLEVFRFIFLQENKCAHTTLRVWTKVSHSEWCCLVLLTRHCNQTSKKWQNKTLFQFSFILCEHRVRSNTVFRHFILKQIWMCFFVPIQHSQVQLLNSSHD